MYIIMLLISHTIADFIIQTDEIMDYKSDFKIKGYIYHGLGLLLTSIPIFALSKINSLPDLFIRTIIIVIVHQLIDYVKEKLKNKTDLKKRKGMKMLAMFFLGQLLHIIIIIIIGQGVIIEFNNLNKLIVERLLLGNEIGYQQLKMGFIILFSAFSGAKFIPLMLDILYKKIPNYAKSMDKLLKKDVTLDTESQKFIDEVNTGRWIGVLERLLISAALVLQQIQLIGFIIAAKSLARFKLMDNKIFSEYFLIGTLLSVIYTFSIYSIFNTLL